MTVHIARAVPERAAVELPVAQKTRATLVVALVAVVLAVPLLVALAVLHRPHWYPLLDLAQTEMRVRDVTSVHPPLIGLPGRIGSFPNQGSHPGPISFYALAVFYNLFGRSAFALQAATACVHAVAIVVALWIARRRGGVPLVLAVGAALALLSASYGGAILTEGWNPYLPVMWWFVFLLATWSVLCDDLPLLPVAVVAGTFCMETHLPYLGIAGVMIAGTFVLIAITKRRDAIRWGAIAIGVGALLWLPPIVEQFTHHPGNLSEIGKELRHPRQAAVGLHDGLRLFFVHLDPWRLVTNRGLVPSDRPIGGSIVPGVLFFVLWAAAAVLAWRSRDRAVVRLHAVIAAALVLGAISMVKISGTIWYYLVLWSWGTTVLAGFAIIATAVALFGPRLDVTQRTRAARVGTGALVATILVSTVFFVDEAAYTQVPNPPVNASLSKVVPQTIRALRERQRRDAPRGGYLVTWDDPMTVGARGYALLNELERHGFDAGTTSINRVGVRTHRVMNPKDASVQVHLVAGRAIAAWARRPNEVRVAYDEPRSAAQRVESLRLRADAERRLRAAGHADLAAAVDGDNFLAVAYDPRTSAHVLSEVTRLEVLGVPLAVFIGPPQ